MEFLFLKINSQHYQMPFIYFYKWMEDGINWYVIYLFYFLLFLKLRLKPLPSHLPFQLFPFQIFAVTNYLEPSRGAKPNSKIQFLLILNSSDDQWINKFTTKKRRKPYFLRILPISGTNLNPHFSDSRGFSVLFFIFSMVMILSTQRIRILAFSFWSFIIIALFS